MNIKLINPLPLDRWREYKDLRLEAVQNSPAAFLGSYEEQSKEPDLFWINRVEQAFSQQASDMFFAEVDEKLIGMAVALVDIRKKTKHVASIKSVYVSPAFRGMGVAKKIMQTVITKMKSRKIKKVKIEFIAGNVAAQRLYEQLGFKVIGTCKMESYVNGKYYDEVLLETYL